MKQPSAGPKDILRSMLLAVCSIALATQAHAVYDGTQATEQPTGVLFDTNKGFCTGAQVEHPQCILSAAHCAKLTFWTAHPAGTTTPGLSIPPPPREDAAIDSFLQLGNGGEEPEDQAQDLAILYRRPNARLPSNFYLLNLRPQTPFYRENRVWRLYGRGETEAGPDPNARVREALMSEDSLYTDVIYGSGFFYFGKGMGAYYRLEPWDNGAGEPDRACEGDSGGPAFRGDLRGVISGGKNESFGSGLWGSLACGKATSNQVTATSLNGNGDFLTFAVAQECCVCIPADRAPFCHFDDDYNYACYNGAECNVKGVWAENPDGVSMPLCHHSNCFDPQSGVVYETPTHCGGGGRPPNQPPIPPPGDPTPPPKHPPSDPTPPPHRGDAVPPPPDDRESQGDGENKGDRESKEGQERKDSGG